MQKKKGPVEKVWIHWPTVTIIRPKYESKYTWPEIMPCTCSAERKKVTGCKGWVPYTIQTHKEL